MVVGIKKHEENKALIMVGSRFFIVAPQSLSRVLHAKCVFFLGSKTEFFLLMKSLLRFSKVSMDKASLRVNFSEAIVLVRRWNFESFLGVASPLGFGARALFSINPKVAYQWALKYSKSQIPLKGGVILGNLVCGKRVGFDSFRFYSSLLLLTSLSNSTGASSYKGRRSLYLGDYLSEKRVYSHLLNYVVGILGQRKLLGYTLITYRGRIIAYSVRFFPRKNVDSFW